MFLVDTNLYFGGMQLRSRAVTVVTERSSSVRNSGGTASRYFPYGEEQQVTSQDRDKFGTYYRDGTTGLDYAQNRYYANTLGRFLTPDPAGASAVAIQIPSSWNMFAHANSDPVNLIDPSGLDPGPIETCNIGSQILPYPCSVIGFHAHPSAVVDFVDKCPPGKHAGPAGKCVWDDTQITQPLPQNTPQPVDHSGDGGGGGAGNGGKFFNAVGTELKSLATGVACLAANASGLTSLPGMTGSNIAGVGVGGSSAMAFISAFLAQFPRKPLQTHVRERGRDVHPSGESRLWCSFWSWRCGWCTGDEVNNRQFHR
jgi:RHS repeat-associated protein